MELPIYFSWEGRVRNSVHVKWSNRHFKYLLWQCTVRFDCLNLKSTLPTFVAGKVLLFDTPGSETEDDVHVDHVEKDEVKDHRVEDGIQSESDAEAGAAVQKGECEINFVSTRKVWNLSANDKYSVNLEHLRIRGQSEVQQGTASTDGAEKGHALTKTVAVESQMKGSGAKSPREVRAGTNARKIGLQQRMEPG